MTNKAGPIRKANEFWLGSNVLCPNTVRMVPYVLETDRGWESDYRGFEPKGIDYTLFDVEQVGYFEIRVGLVLKYTFVVKEANLRLETEGSGQCSAPQDGYYDAGATVKLTAKPLTSTTRLEGWYLDGQLVCTEWTYAFEMPDHPIQLVIRCTDDEEE